MEKREIIIIKKADRELSEIDKGLIRHLVAALVFIYRKYGIRECETCKRKIV